MLAAALLILGQAAPAEANSKYASVVMDAESGEVLYARNADETRYPASLTKMMTLYMLFEAIEQGEFTLESEMPVSARAAGRAPSKLGVKAGEKITVERAIEALVIRSANDVATVVAEALGGTEWQFAKDMTQRARQLGMRRTTFRNASGWPDRRQVTTARDMAILTFRLLQDFPQYHAYYEQRTFTHQGRTWTTHNHFLKNYDGAYGVKTGYTRASGFNLAAAARRHERDLIGVVMGGRTWQRRDNDMKRILSLSFKRVKENPDLGLMEIAAKPRPRPGAGGSVMVASAAAAAEEGGAPARAAAVQTAAADLPATPQPRPFRPDADASAELVLAALGTAPRPNPFTAEPAPEAEVPMGDAAPKKTIQRADEIVTASLIPDISLPSAADRYGVGEEDAARDGEPLRSAAVAALPPESLWGIQIGAFSRASSADAHLAEAAQLAETTLTRGLAAVVPVERETGVLYRARFGPLSQKDAMDACDRLQQGGMTCFAFTEPDWTNVLRR